MTDFLSMGGYAAFVWSAYGITLLVLAVSVWTARRKRLDALEHARQAAQQEHATRQATVRQVQ